MWQGCWIHNICAGITMQCFSSFEIKARFVKLGDTTVPWHTSAGVVKR